MYRCESCGSVVGPNQPAIKVVTETRERNYPQRPDANARSKKARRRSKSDPGGAGLEIAEEQLLCRSCTQQQTPLD